jgi:hypothetical protein
MTWIRCTSIRQMTQKSSFPRRALTIKASHSIMTCCAYDVKNIYRNWYFMLHLFCYQLTWCYSIAHEYFPLPPNKLIYHLDKLLLHNRQNSSHSFDPSIRWHRYSCILQTCWYKFHHFYKLKDGWNIHPRPVENNNNKKKLIYKKNENTRPPL